MFGDEESRNVSAIVVDNFYMPHADGWVLQGSEHPWVLDGAGSRLLVDRHPGPLRRDRKYWRTLNRVRDRVASLHRMQVDNGAGARGCTTSMITIHPKGAPNRTMAAPHGCRELLLEADHHVLTSLTGDPVARDSILMAVDDLRARYLATGNYAGVSFVYLGCSRYVDGMPDLDNPFRTHAFGYAYSLTNDATYRTLGTSLFNTAVVLGYTGSHKHYDQQFRSSGRFAAQ